MDIQNKVFENGIRLFKQNNYQDAIIQFNNLLELYKHEQKLAKSTHYHKNYSNVLDCLSACYVKLNNVEKALKCAKIMIHVDLYNPKGYLRLNKVYLSINETFKAYEVLKKGYTKIRQFKNSNQNGKINESLYEQLKTELKKQKDISTSNAQKSKEIELPKCQDPLQKLPIDIINLIFKQFPLSFNIQCLTVSSYWHDLLIGSTNIFDDITLKKNIRKQSFEKCLKFIIKHNQKKKMQSIFINSINIEPHDSCENSILSLFFGRKNIQVNHLSITLNSCNYHALYNYMKVNFSLLSNLKSLKLNIPLIINETSNLEILLRECYNLSNLVLIISKFDNRSKKSTGIGVHLESLKSLSISVDPNATNNKLNNILLDDFLLGNHFPRLQSLTLSRVNIQPTTLSTIISPYLKSIELDHIPNVSTVQICECLLRKSISNKDGNLNTLKVVETETENSLTLSHNNWFNSFHQTKIFSNLSTLMLRNSGITPNLLNDILKSTNCNIKNLHLVLNSNLVFENKLSSSNNQPSPTNGYCQITDIIEKIPRIQQLSLVGCPRFNNLTLKEMIQYSHNNHCFDDLNYLNLSMNKIDGDTLIKIFNRPNNLRLQKLVIQYCQIDPDTVHYIRTQKLSLSVDYKMSDRVIL